MFFPVVMYSKCRMERINQEWNFGDINRCRMLLKHCFEQLRSTQVAVVHCSAQTNPTHVLQKLSQSCMVLNTNTGRVYRPKDCERLVLYLKDLNLPKPDKWGTCQLVAFLQQVPSYSGVVKNFRGQFSWMCIFLSP